MPRDKQLSPSFRSRLSAYFRDSVRSWSGLIGWILVLARPANWALTVLGDIDLFSNYGGAIGHFLNTGIGTAAIVVIGASIIGLAIYNRERTALPSRAPPLTAEGQVKIQTEGGADYDIRTPIQGGILHVIRVKIINATGSMLTSYG
jgi:hypothetical protein